MELKYSKNKIELEKELNSIDKFVIGFTSILNKNRIRYVVVSGYVAILFGRSRSSEDIDIIMEKMAFSKFKNLWDKLSKRFECMNTKDAGNAYFEYLGNDCPVRFSKKGKYIPNIEAKLPKNDLDILTLRDRKRIMLNGHRFYISPIELQIAFKMYLDSEKDIEDARYMYRIFKEHLDFGKLLYFSRKLKIEKRFNRYIEKGIA